MYAGLVRWEDDQISWYAGLVNKHRYVGRFYFRERKKFLKFLKWGYIKEKYESNSDIKKKHFKSF